MAVADGIEGVVVGGVVLGGGAGDFAAGVVGVGNGIGFHHGAGFGYLSTANGAIEMGIERGGFMGWDYGK